MNSTRSTEQSGIVRYAVVGLVALLSLTIALLGGLSADAAEETHADFFERSIRPLLVEHCQQCHGAKKQESGLRLDSRAAVLKGGEHGPAVAVGEPDESLLIKAVRYQGDVHMPPKQKLSETHISHLARWIELGVLWTGPVETAVNSSETQRRHWAFQPIANPQLPLVNQPDWEKTPVDRFVLSKLEAAGLAPSAVADRRTLIRRASYDLTGLPPTPEEVETFVNDSRPDAYEQLVDRLLESPQYGEQWGRHWLDVARYSDTKGYVYSREERFWVHAANYRDWVVQAFNQDLPYDRFLLQQIAADQTASDDPGDLAAMGFLTVGRRFLGVTHDIIDDRIDVVMRGTMGLTVACARCHDHKYDPIPTADYYSLYGVFSNSIERLVPITSRTIRNDADTKFYAELDQRHQKLRETMLAKRKEAADRVRQRVTDYLVAQTELAKYPEEGFDQVLLPTDIVPMFVRRWEAWLSAASRQNDPVFGPWRRFAQLKPDEFVASSESLVRQLKEGSEPVNTLVTQALTPPPGSLRELAERYGRLLIDVERQWKSLCDDSQARSEPVPTRLMADDAEALRQVLYGAGSPCEVPDEPIVTTELFFDLNACTELWRLQGEVDRWLIQSPLAPPFALTLTDREPIRPSRIFRRGNPALHGPEVSRHFVTAIAGPTPPPFQQGSGRWELARAIIDPSNPLTARVWVNRVWQHHFGVGLVRTSSDFGLRSTPPSHPELLDWLATRFMAEGWSTKKLHRLILLSNTYQQTSEGRSDPGIRTRTAHMDPENRLLSRMNVRRLSFEEYRDSLLSVAGRLDLQLGGRGTDLFAGGGTVHHRRTLYGLIDRQFLPATLRVFDFANPDLHVPVRSETTVPQQALFVLNHPFLAQQARALAASAHRDDIRDPAEKVRRLYRAAYRREPTGRQLDAALTFVTSAVETVAPPSRPESLTWQYGYGEFDPNGPTLKSFQLLPHFTGSAWQGGPAWPDAALGWVQLTARGGHPGNDQQHCSIRRWVAPHGGTFSIKSTAIHEVEAGNGIRCWIYSSRGGVLKTFAIHNTRQEMNVESITLQPGDTVDFIVDIHGHLNNDQHLWAPVVEELAGNGEPAGSSTNRWESERDFAGPAKPLLNPWEQLSQVLLMANEMMFVD